MSFLNPETITYLSDDEIKQAKRLIKVEDGKLSIESSDLNNNELVTSANQRTSLMDRFLASCGQTKRPALANISVINSSLSISSELGKVHALLMFVFKLKIYYFEK